MLVYRARIFIFSCLFLLLSGCSSTQSMQQSSSLAKAANIHLQLAMVYLHQQQFSAVKRQLLAAQVEHAQNALLDTEWAFYYQSITEDQQALSEYRQALKLSPKSANIWNDFALFLCHIGGYAKAKAAFAVAINSPNNTELALTYMNAGLCAKKYHYWRSAAVYLRHAYQMNPHNAVPLWQLTILAYHQHQYTVAQYYLGRYIHQFNNDAQSIWLGFCMAEAKRDAARAAHFALQIVMHFSHSRAFQRFKQYEWTDGRNNKQRELCRFRITGASNAS